MVILGQAIARVGLDDKDMLAETVLACVVVGTVAMTGLVYLLVDRRTRYARELGVSVDLHAPKPHPSAPSLYTVIRKETSNGTERLRSYDPFPELPDDAAPGARDITTIQNLRNSPSQESSEWKIVCAVVRMVQHGIIKDWRVVEQNISRIDPVTAYSPLMQEISALDVGPRVARIFWQAALESSDYTMVKWGILIAGLQPMTGHFPALKVLAAHPEFTLFACAILTSSASSEPGRRDTLPEILAVASGTGLYHVVRHITDEPELMSRYDVNRMLMTYAMGFPDTWSIAVTVTMVSRVDLPALLHDAAADEELTKALLTLATFTFAQEELRAELVSRPDAGECLDGYIALLRTVPADIDVVYALACLLQSNTSFQTSGLLTEKRVETTLSTLHSRVTDRMLREALAHDETRYQSLTVIASTGRFGLAPELVAELKRRPEPIVIHTLAMIGNRSHFEMLLGMLPDLVGSPVRHGGGDESEWTIDRRECRAAIIASMGMYAGPEPLRAIKAAAYDPYPAVRVAAMKAISELPLCYVDRELTAAVDFCRKDPQPNIRESAHITGVKLGIYPNTLYMAPN